MEALIQEAISKLRKVILLYRCGGRVLKTYVVAPYELKLKRGKLYCYAWEYDKQHLSSFLVSRIEAITMTDETFTPRKILTKT